MFSTILDKATGYFDKRALISAFFPSLVFWGLVTVVYIGFQINWSVAVHSWDTFSGTVQLLLLLAFFVWVTFWSFLTINFRMAYTRLFEGYWPEQKPLTGLRRRWQEGWQFRWTTLSDEDKQLEKQEASLLAEQESFKQLPDTLATAATNQSVTTGTGQNQTGQECDDFLSAAEQKLFPDASPKAKPLSLPQEEVLKLSQQVHSWWMCFVPWLAEAEQNPNGPWGKRQDRLEKITASLSKMVDEQLEQVQSRRLSLYRELSLYYPPTPGDMMPTRLGNVLKASELYSWRRYRLDAVVIWSRLQSCLPAAFSDPLQDTKTSFDLMVTLSAFLLLFGVPLSFWIAIKSPGFVPWWVALILALVVLAFRLYIPAVLAGLAFVLPLLIAWLWHPVPWIISLQTLTVLLVTLAALFWLCYQNTVQAALDYGEKIKAAFDLYRWEVLKQLHLQLPKDFEDERKIWTEVGGLLLHGYVPYSQYYRFSEEKAESKEATYD